MEFTGGRPLVPCSHTRASKTPWGKLDASPAPGLLARLICRAKAEMGMVRDNPGAPLSTRCLMGREGGSPSA